MPSTPLIQQILTDVAAMETAFEQQSCIPNEPMVKYPDSGNPPTINFNIPQSTAFTTYGRLLKYIDPTWFKAFTKVAPTYNFFDYVKTLSPTAMTQLFHPNVMAASPVVGQFFPTNIGGAGAPPLTSGAASAPRSPLNVHMVAHATAAQITGQVAQPLMLTSMPTSAASPLVDFATQGIRGLYTHRFMNGGAVVRYIAQPTVPVPRIFVIEEYTTESFLGNYGAGKVIKTLTLLPGEKTTISIRTYKDQSSTSSASDNVLDSFSDSAATELDNLMQQEMGQSDSLSATQGGNDTSYNTHSDSHNSTSAWTVGGSLGFNTGVVSGSINGSYGRSTADTSTSSGGFADSQNYSATGARASNINTLSNAINKSVQPSNAARQMDVNHTTSSTADSGEEDVTVREIQNVNLSRVLNFTFRQLLQQYTTITYLSGLKFAYCNGYQESYTVVDLANLPSMLTDLIDVSTDPTRIDKVMCLLLRPYCHVMNYNDDFRTFVEAVDIPLGNCLTTWLPLCNTDTSELLWRKAKTCTDTYSDDVVDITVNGVILNVQKQTLQTDSLIGDALMGAGEALDCFNQKAQDATTMAAYINNLQSMQQLETNIQDMDNDQDIADQKLATIQAIIDTPDPISAATLYKKVYGDCCDVPQNTDNGCGCA